MKIEKQNLFKILSKYCKKIRYGKHIVCYPLVGNEVISVSSTMSDFRALKSVYRDFKRNGIEIEEFKNLKG